MVAAKLPGLQVVLLGSAQDGGVPHPACRCPQCQRARAGDDPRRMPASLGLVDAAAGQRYIIDTTLHLTRQLELLDQKSGTGAWSLRYPVDGVFLTHGHFGHVGGLPLFGKEAAATRALPVWCTRDLADYLQTNRPFRDLVREAHIKLEQLNPGETVMFAGGRWSITPLAVPHRTDVTDTVGFRIDGPVASLMYIPDTDRLTPPLITSLAAVDYVLVDGTFFSSGELGDRPRADVPHPPIQESMVLLGSPAPNNVWFVHLNHTNPAVSRISQARHSVERHGFGIAYEGQTWAL